MIGEIDNFALALSIDSCVRFIDEVIETFGMPVIPPRLAGVPVHALLDNGPMTVSRYDEAVQIEIKAVLDGCAIDLGDQRLARVRASPSKPTRSPSAFNSSGVLRE